VDTASTQEEGPPGPGPVNTGFILDMQRKLYCWSRNDPERVNDELDGVRFYPEVTRPVSGFTWIGECLR
jgi:hypothetical protein